ncbi:hypothetical protein CAAN3_03S08834 [[Candida] anglica]
MFTISILSRLLTIPYVLAKLTVEYFSIGTVFTNFQTNRSIRRIWTAGIMQHMIKVLTVPFIRDHASYTVSSLLDKLLSTVNGDGGLPGYGEFYTKRKCSLNSIDAADWGENPHSVDSLWLAHGGPSRSKNDPILIYIHGGCFAMQLQSNAVEVLANVYRVLSRESNPNLSVLIVDYSLTTTGSKYPQQVNECGQIYDQLVREGNTNIAVMGDSAGGNLSLALLYYLQRVHPKGTVWPSAVVPISAWLDITAAQYSGSFRKNEALDVFSYRAVEYFGEAYVGTESDLDRPDLNISSLSSSYDWSKLPPVAKGNVLVVFGEHEVLRDENFRWCTNAGIIKNHPENVIIEPLGYHISFFVSEGVAFGDLESWKEQSLTKQILSFLNKKL